MRGSWALVTGASSGMGRAIAQALAARGVNLLVNFEPGITEFSFAAGLFDCSTLRAVMKVQMRETLLEGFLVIV